MRTWRRLKGILTYVNVILKGFLFGIANIIPGMSGGTLALVLGIYERLVRALNNINSKTAQKTFNNNSDRDAPMAQLNLNACLPLENALFSMTI